MSWYSKGRMCLALRKHMLRTDMRIYVGEPTDFSNDNDFNTTIKSMITAAIMKGLDIVGVVSATGPAVGVRAQQIVSSNQSDLWIIPGQEYHTADKFHLIAYNINSPLPENLNYDQIIAHVKKQHGFVMVTQVSKRQMQHFNSILNTPAAPDAIEVYNASTGLFQDMNTEYPKFATSGARSSNELEMANIFTLKSRKEIEAMGLLPVGEGSEYLPPYLTRDDRENPLPDQNLPLPTAPEQREDIV